MDGISHSKHMLTFNDKGIYCARAGVYIDPWQPVERAIITHAHADHARWGSAHYLCHRDTVPLLRLRLGEDISAQPLEYGQGIVLNGVKVSLHPAGHIIGSAQVRLEYKGEVWVVSGDYKCQPDGICTPFEALRCHHFVTESTFGLPIYHFKQEEEVRKDVQAWLGKNREEGKHSILVGYSLGKAQRIIEMLPQDGRTVYAHGAVVRVQDRLIAAGHKLRPVRSALLADLKKTEGPITVIVPPSALGTPWIRRFQPGSTAYFSGWMQLRGARRRRNVDRGFALSDHADWPQLNEAIAATGASHVYVTHGYKSIFAKWLREEKGLDAVEVDTLYDENEEAVAKEGAADEEV